MGLGGGEHRKTFGSLIIEMILIALGVFLALWANNWHEDREHRAQAKAALRNFLGEMEANRDATQSKRLYHETLETELTQYLTNKDAPGSKERFDKEVHFTGLLPVTYEHTAWDLALATQALSYLKPQLAFVISKVYTGQNAFQALENSFLASTFPQASTSAEDSMRGLAPAMMIYLIDANKHERDMISLYEKVIPEVKSALGVKPDR